MTRCIHVVVLSLGLLTASCASRHVIVGDLDTKTLTYDSKPVTPDTLVAAGFLPTNARIDFILKSKDGASTNDFRDMGLVDCSLLFALFGPPMTPEESAQFNKRESEWRQKKEQGWQAKIKPALDYVTEFQKNSQRLPSREEFDAWRDKRHDLSNLNFISAPDFISKKGGRAGHDFVIGTWESEWYYYFQSWDGRYIDDARYDKVDIDH